MSQFFATKKMFANIIGIDNDNESLNYESWMAIPDSYKSAALFVNFYPHIKAAWNSAKGAGVDEEDGIECVLQYLEKNVEKIKSNPNRYTSKYIYSVSWNSMGCLRRTKSAQLRPRFEVSNIATDATDEEFDLFDSVVDIDHNVEVDVVADAERDEFWADIEALFMPKDKDGNPTDDSKAVLKCHKYEKVIQYLLNGESLGKAREKVINENPDNPLLPVSVSRRDFERIIKDLRVKLEKYKEVFLGTNLIPATEEDLIPAPLRKKPKISAEIYAHLCKTSKLAVEDAIRTFAVTSDSYKDMMFKLQNSGEPIKAHWVDGGTEAQEVDYFYVVSQ